MKLLLVILFGFFLTGAFTSCKKDPVSVHQCDTCNKLCDTCNVNQDSLQRVKDSLAHAFAWQQLNILQEASLTGCWVFAQNDIYIVGNSLWHFDGSTFTVIPAFDRTYNNVTMNGALNGSNIFAFSKTDFWMINYGIAYHTSDGKYFDDKRPGGAIISSWGISSNDMFFVGDAGSIFHYDGTKFDSMSSGTTEDLQSVWGTSSSDIWACGFNYSTGGTVIEHYDGNSWSVDNLTNSNAKRNGFEAVWTCDSSNHKFVATSGAFVYRKTDNGNWRNDSTTIPNSLGGGTYVGLYLLRGNSPNDIMASGGWGWVGHWNGKTWKKYDALYDYNNGDYIPNALSMNGNTACVVGTKGGASWVAIGTRKQ